MNTTVYIDQLKMNKTTIRDDPGNENRDKNSELIEAIANETKNLFLNLPDDIMFILLQFCDKEDITETRELHSDWI